MIEFKNINYKVGEFSLKNISFRINDGEFFSIVGSSGSGKSVLLDLIVGFRKCSSGEIIHNGENVSEQSIQKRPFRIVFQDLSLFPHLSVRKNIEYGLKSQTINKEKRNQLIAEWSKKCSVEKLLNRQVESLSGGEKQRVAIARSAVTNPDILLLDEPLSSLDVNLQDEFIQLFSMLNKSGLSIIHVTHDFVVASKLSHRIALISEGEIVQIGKPIDFYNSPKHPFVAKFAGHKNIFRVNLKYNINTQLTEAVEFESGITFYISENCSGEAFIFIPEESLILSNENSRSSAQNCLAGEIKELICIGNRTEVNIDVGIIIKAVVSNESIKTLNFSINSKIYVQFKASSIGVIPIC